MIPLEGSSRIAQRFAADWILLGPDGRAWKGDSSSNANWYGYNAPLLAVADARVSAVVDGIVENVPLSPTRAVAINLETVGGNHVILDLGGGQYAFYAHLVPGSATVKVGDQVKKGQVLGRLGNSGNSDAPHLHFHLGDANSPLGTEGIPWVFERFEGLGRVTSLMAALGPGWKAGAAPAARTRELPLENEIVMFP
jgi:murein DD-endopeptidase MepM/ murein hydrolase activator NlpD